MREAKTWFIALNIAILALGLFYPLYTLYLNFNMPLKSNFLHDTYSFWSAGKAMWAKGASAALDFKHISTFQQDLIAQSGKPVVPFYYAPSFFYLLCLGLALMPFWAAASVFFIGQGALYVAIAYPLARQIAPKKLAILYVMCFSAFWWNIISSQNGVITAALFVAALLHMEKKPLFSGLFFALFAYKPQLCILIPFALMAGKYYKVVSYGLLFYVIMVILTLSLWGDFFYALSNVQEYVLNSKVIKPFSLPSTYASVFDMGGSYYLVIFAQIFTTLFALTLTLIVWAKPLDWRIKAAFLILATPLATPYVMYYDLIAIGAALIWLKLTLFKKTSPLDKAFFTCLWALPYLCQFFTVATNISLMPLLLCATLVWIFLRIISTKGLPV